MREPARAVAVLGGLGLSAVALAVAPLFVPSDYSWTSHTTSEAAAQGIEGAWMAQLGFLLLGLAVMVLSTGAARRWGVGGVVLHGAPGRPRSRRSPGRPSATVVTTTAASSGPSRPGTWLAVPPLSAMGTHQAQDRVIASTT